MHESRLFPWSRLGSRRTFRPHLHRRPFRRNVATEEQIKTAELQKTPHTPNQIVTEVPHSKEPSLIDVPSPLWYHRLGPVKDFFSWFSRMQRRRPLTVNFCTSLTTYFLGDKLAQDIGGEPYDGMRTLRMLSIGALASIPGYKWFLFLGSHFNYQSRFWSITVKVLIQQIFFAPIFNTYFFGMQAALTGQPPSVVIHRISQAVPESVLNSMKFWPAVTAVNFIFIPAAFRFMFAGAFAVVWQTYLSFLNRKEELAGPVGTLADQGRQELYEESVAEDSTTEDSPIGETPPTNVSAAAKSTTEESRAQT